MAESGRWDTARRANVAWPWTVYSEGQGHRFATKTDAVTLVLELWAQGVSNIDVGCMQVNLHFHGGAFADIEEALDPAANVAYASRYLKGLYQSTASWPRAAEFYHSATPRLGQPYREKVMGLWRQLGGDTGTYAGDSGNPGRGTAPSARPDIDFARTAQLNARFKALRTAARDIDDRAARHQMELDAWRQARVKSMDASHVAIMRRAELETQRKLRRTGAFETSPQADFEAKRRAQLDEWRNKVAANGP